MPPVTIPAICRSAWAYGYLTESVDGYLKGSIDKDTLRTRMEKASTIANGRGDLVIEEGE